MIIINQVGPLKYYQQPNHQQWLSPFYHRSAPHMGNASLNLDISVQSDLHIFSLNTQTIALDNYWISLKKSSL